MKQHSDFVRLLSDLFLLLIGVLGAVFCLITAFDLAVPESFSWVSIGSLAVFSLVLGDKKRDKTTALILLGILLLLAFLFRSELAESFRDLWGYLSSTFALGYEYFENLVPEEFNKTGDYGPAILALTVLVSYISSLSVRVWKRTTPMALALMLFVAPCFILLDTPPDTPPLLAAVFSVLTQAFSQSVRRRGEGEHFKAVCCGAILAAVLLGVLLMLFPQKTYTPPITWAQLSKKIEQLGRKLENRGNAQAGLTGNQEAVDLSSLGALPNRPIPILYATSSEDAYLYLRGASYSVFDGTYWSHGDSQKWRQNALFPYVGGKGGATLSIETLDPEDLIYTTYHLTSMPAGGTLVSDAYIDNSTDTLAYTMHYVQDTKPVSPSEVYDQWVRETCLALPEQTRAGMLSWWNAQELSAHTVPYNSDPAAVQRFAEAVAAQVATCAKYSRNPARMPAGVDFCTWFLNDAEEGYCVHYASACTALLRALGIPARYVSGYVCEATANERASVTNLQAHAWVEIWVGGRWVNVEPTPEDATEFTGIIPGQDDTPVTEPPETKDPDQRPDPHINRDREVTEPTLDTEAPGSVPGHGGGKSQPLDLTFLWFFLVAIGVPALILGRRTLVLRHWENRILKATGNHRARLLYQRMCRLEKLGGGAIPEEALTLAKKASFSQHTLTDVELAAMRQVCDEQSSRLKIATFWHRVYYKYVLAVI